MLSILIVLSVIGWCLYAASFPRALLRLRALNLDTLLSDQAGGYNFDIAAATPILKNRYTKEKIQTLAFKSALFALIQKDEDQGGQQYVGAIRSAVGSTASHLDTVAFVTGSSSIYNQWLCPWAYGYGSANVTGSAIDQSKGDVNALVDAMVGEFDGAFIDLGQQLGADLFGNGGGAFGQISSGSNTGTATITLADTSKMFNFYQGQILQSSQDDGTGGNGVRVGTVTLTKVDIISGTLTASGNWTAGITGCAASDYIFQDGNYNGAFAGLAGWIPPPASRPTSSTTFNGVNRSGDQIRLSGVYKSGSGAQKTETMMSAAGLVQRMNGRPDYLALNPMDYVDVELDMGGRIQYVTVEAFENAQVSFDGIRLATAYGMITLLMDIFCPLGIAYMLELNTWLIPSVGEVPRIAGPGVDGLEWLRNAGADSYQARFKYIATTYNSAPGRNCVIAW